MPSIVLASTSPFRRELLSRLGLDFECLAPLMGEDELKQNLGDAKPGTVAARLAIEKAESLIPRRRESIIIGSDQVVELDGELLGKPGSVERAIQQLKKLSGRSHDLITALAFWHEFHVSLRIDVTTLHMRRLTDDEISRYVAFDNPVNCAGSYKIESQGIALFEEIESIDQTAIVGLPLMATVSLLKRCGIVVP